MSDPRLFTVEYDAEGETLEMHLNRAGRDALIAILQSLGAHGGNDDRHLFTEDWGGDELSNEAQGEANNLVHHLKIFFWDQDDDAG